MRKHTSVRPDASLGGPGRPPERPTFSPIGQLELPKKNSLLSCPRSRTHPPQPRHHARTATVSPRCAPLRPHSRCCLAARGRNSPTAAITSTAGAARRGQRSRPPAAILLLHRDRTTRSCCVVLRSPADQVLLKSACCKRMFKVFYMF
jgi:hypothetical protein